MYESKLKKYNKLFLICLVIYYICLSAVFVSGGFLHENLSILQKLV